MRKKYFVRALAALPMLSVGTTLIILLVMVFDNAWWILLAIGDFWAFMLLCRDYEWYVRCLANFLEDMANDARHE